MGKPVPGRTRGRFAVVGVWGAVEREAGLRGSRVAVSRVAPGPQFALHGPKVTELHEKCNRDGQRKPRNGPPKPWMPASRGRYGSCPVTELVIVRKSRHAQHADPRRPQALGGRHPPTPWHRSRSRPGLDRKTPWAVACDYRVTDGIANAVQRERGFVVMRTGRCDPVSGGGGAARPTPRGMLPSAVGSAERCNFVNPHVGQATSWCLLPPHSGQTSYAITDSERIDARPFPRPLCYDFSPVVGGPHVCQRAVPWPRSGRDSRTRCRLGKAVCGAAPRFSDPTRAAVGFTCPGRADP